jgi:hypothetical protein
MLLISSRNLAGADTGTNMKVSYPAAGHRRVVTLSQTLVTNLIYLDRTDARWVGIVR